MNKKDLVFHSFTMLFQKNKNKWLYLLILIVLPMVIKLFIAYSVFGPYDLSLYEEWATTFHKGLNPYIAENNPSFYPLGYGPPLFYIFYLAYKISLATNIPFYFLEKIPIIIFDTIISIVLFFVLSKKHSINTSFFWSLFFALNPLVIFSSSVHGQYHSIPVFFLLLSYFSFQSKNPFVRTILSEALLGFGATFKVVALFFAPLLFFKHKIWKEKTLFTISVLSAFLLPFIISSFNFISSFYEVVFHRPSLSPSLNWGFAKPLLFFDRFIDMSALFGLLEFGRILLPLLLVLISFLIRKKPLLNAYLVIFFSFYSFTFFMHPHYLYWVLPFLFLKPSTFSLVYWIPITLHLGFLDVFYHISGYAWLSTIGNQPSDILSFGFGILAWIFCLYGFLKYTSLWKAIKKRLGIFKKNVLIGFSNI